MPKNNVFRLSAVALALATMPAYADLTNGNFENGLTGWTATVAGSANPVTLASGSTNASAGTLAPSLTSDHYVYTSQTSPGYSLLTQAFTVQSGTNKVFFDIAIINGAAAFSTPDSLDYTGAANQQARFDILKPGSALTTINPADIIVTVYQTEVGDPLTQAWNTQEIDVTADLASYDGQGVIFRFWQVDNQGVFNLAIDNVNVGLSQIAQLLSTLTSASNLGNSPAFNAASVIDANATLLAPFVSLIGNDAAISNAVSQTLPLLVGGSQIASSSAQSGIYKVIQARLENNRGLSSGDEFYGDKHIWMKPFGSWADQDDRGGVSGYKADVAGLAFGADGTISDRTRLGASFAYAKADVDGNSTAAPNSAEVDVYQLVGYGSYSLNATTELNFQVGVGQNSNKGNRILLFNGTTASSDYDSTVFTAGFGVGRAYQLSESASFTPSIRADYSWIKDKGYTETGAGIFNLTIDSRQTEEFILSLEGKYNREISDGAIFNANLGLGYDFMNQAQSITSTFAGAPGAAFTTTGIKPDALLIRGGLGISKTTTSGMEILGRYDVEAREDFLNQTASVKLRWIL